MKITREEFKKALQIVQRYEEQIKQDLKEIQKTKIVSNPTLLYLVDNEEICVRTYNVLKSLFNMNGDTKIAELQGYNVYDIVNARNFGKGSMIELDFVCKKYKISLSTSQPLKHIRGISLLDFKSIIDVS